MKRRVTDYPRAFVVALKMTVRGEKPAALANQEAYAPLLDWCRRTLALVDQVDAASQGQSSYMLRIEGRDVMLTKVLALVRFHAAQEFPMLVRQGGSYVMIGIQSTNLNDRYMLGQFAHSEGLAPHLRSAIAALDAHLANVPTIQAS